MGLMGFGWAIGCATGTFLGDYIFDISGSYINAFWLGGLLTLIGMIFIFLLNPPAKMKPAG